MNGTRLIKGQKVLTAVLRDKGFDLPLDYGEKDFLYRAKAEKE